MLNITQDIQSLTYFRRNSANFMKRIKRTKRPVILTVNGKAEAVVLDAAAYQGLLDQLARADAREGIRQGLEDLKHGRHQPARQALAAFRRKHAIAR